MKTSDFHFELPEQLIAQTPSARRDYSRMMCLCRKTGAVSHHRFYELDSILKPGDLLVLNDSRVIPARLFGRRLPGGAVVEFLLLEQKTADTWEVTVRPGRKAMPGNRFSFGEDSSSCGKAPLSCEIIEVIEDGNRLAKFTGDKPIYQVLDEIGNMPLPPYITAKLEDNERYQTVYSKERGSAAAPTAGLHFTHELLSGLKEYGIDTAMITLHVGLGTFRPVKAEVVANHHMHSEWYHIPKEAADKINRAKENGGRVIAVGTTSCRTLESVIQNHGRIVPCDGRTDIFIYPGYKFKAIDGLITNFHLPESTLIMLVSAFAGYGHTMAAYKTAVEEQYRFFSFGDCMAIL